MSLVLLSFLAGILTVLAPCAFMLLPVIIGGSVGSKSRIRPYIITISLALSLLLFTLILKVSSLLINVDPNFLKYFSGVSIILLGLVSLFPSLWEKIQVKLGLSNQSDKLLYAASKKEGLFGAVLTGAALGPVFSSCSPTYVFVLTTVLRENFSTGIINVLAYILGLGLVMLGVGLLGRTLVKKLKWAVNPNGIFKRVVAVLFILAGIGILTGFDKQLQTYLVPYSPVNSIEQKLLQNSKGSQDIGGSIEASNAKQAPEITGITEWINSDPQTLEKLKGKVVLIDFWTYSCVNCLRSSPYINAWYDAYKDQGFVVLGLHAPEFAFEKNKANVEKSVKDTYNIKYPVGLDNDFATWDAYNNQFWPAKYLIDKDGKIRYTHFGEGEYDTTEAKIRELLKETGADISNKEMTKVNADSVSNLNLTPETYLGWSRHDKFANKEDLAKMQGFNKPGNYDFKPINSDFWTIQGGWQIDNQSITTTEDNAKLKFKVNANQVFVVAGSQDEAKIQVKVNGKPIQDSKISGIDVNSAGEMVVKDDKLYKIIKA